MTAPATTPTSALEIDTPEQLAELITGRSDKEINDILGALGVDSALDKVFDGMVREFLPEKTKGESAIIQWNITTPDGMKSYHVTVENKQCRVSRGPADARVTLSANAPDFLRIITGKLNSMQAFFQTRLKVSGDVLFAQGHQSWFRILGS
jgi:putative sterol carrier protein